MTLLQPLGKSEGIMATILDLKLAPNQQYLFVAQIVRHISLALAAAIFLMASTALAQAPQSNLSGTESARTSYVDDAALDELFAALADAPSQAAATPIADKIWRIWFSPNVPELDDLMEGAAAAARLGDVSRAIRLLNGVIEEYPTYAEGWNRRATMYFLVGNFAASFADVDEVLAREPRHFGALSGKAIMHLQLGERAKALQAMVAALRIHPYLMERAIFEELLVPPTKT